MATHARTATPSRTSARSAGRYGHLAPLLVRLPELPPGHPERARLRDRLATEFLPLVTHIASRYSGRGEPTDDLRQVGTIGLIGALDRYVPRPDAVDPIGAFLGYAIPTVTGEIRRHFRDKTWAMQVPRRTKELLPRVCDVASVLAAEHRRAPRPSEIAARLGVAIDDVVEALQAEGPTGRRRSTSPAGRTARRSRTDSAAPTPLWRG